MNTKIGGVSISAVHTVQGHESIHGGPAAGVGGRCGCGTNWHARLPCRSARGSHARYYRCLASVCGTPSCHLRLKVQIQATLFSFSNIEGHTRLYKPCSLHFSANANKLTWAKSQVRMHRRRPPRGRLAKARRAAGCRQAPRQSSPRPLVRSPGLQRLLLVKSRSAWRANPVPHASPVCLRRSV